MKKEYASRLLRGGLSGIMLYPVGLTCSELPYFDTSYQTFLCLLSISILLGSAIVVTSTFNRRATISAMVLNALSMFVCYGLLYVLNGYWGTIRYFHAMFSIKSNSAADNVSGMLSLTFLIAMIGVSIISTTVFWLSRVFSSSPKKQ